MEFQKWAEPDSALLEGDDGEGRVAQALSAPTKNNAAQGI
jgi:hypothetical protein